MTAQVTADAGAVALRAADAVVDGAARATAPISAVYSQISGPARVAAASQLMEASSFYRQSLQTLLIFNAVAVFSAPLLVLGSMGGGDGASALTAAAVAYAQEATVYFFAALALALAASFLAHLTIEKRAHAFFVEELVDERRARAALATPQSPMAFEAETEALHRQANAHASLSSTSYATSMFCLFLAVLAMAGGVFGAVDAVAAAALGAG